MLLLKRVSKNSEVISQSKVDALVWGHFLPAPSSDIQVYLRNFMGFIPDHHNKVNDHLFAGRGPCLQFL